MVPAFFVSDEESNKLVDYTIGTLELMFFHFPITAKFDGSRVHDEKKVSFSIEQSDFRRF